MLLSNQYTLQQLRKNINELIHLFHTISDCCSHKNSLVETYFFFFLCIFSIIQFNCCLLTVMVLDAGEEEKTGQELTLPTETPNAIVVTSSDTPGYGHVGIVNNSNMCFFNSMLQVGSTSLFRKLDNLSYSTNRGWIYQKREFS